jgi:tRNA threonylcarbamoyladenosine biosynthesis protein TsaE
VSARDLTLEELDDLARQLWHETPTGATIWLSGDLGSGKTAFVQALARAANAERASSPTYTLIHEYRSPNGPVIHADCYRLHHAAEALDLDFPELERRARLLVLEWPERAGAYAPPPVVHLKFDHVADPTRRRVERIR